MSAPGTPARIHPGRRFHFISMALGLWVIGGVFIDGWAHINLEGATESFFTPWHGVLYSGFAAVSAWTLLPVIRGRGDLRDRIPYGYGLGLVGLGVFFLGAVGDLIWHTLFGIETGIDALLSPTHLLLLAGGLLALTSPIRAAWVEVAESSPPFSTLLPALLSLTLTTTVSTFFLGYAWGVLDPAPGLPVPLAALDENAPGHFIAERAVSYGVVSRIVATILLLAPVLYAMRRWRLPFGSVTLIFTTLTAFMFFLFSDRASLAVAVTPVIAGIAADAFIRWQKVSVERPSTVYVFGGMVPAVLWSLNMAAFSLIDGLGWTVELWTGTIILCALTGIGLSLLAVPPKAQAVQR